MLGKPNSRYPLLFFALLAARISKLPIDPQFRRPTVGLATDAVVSPESNASNSSSSQLQSSPNSIPIYTQQGTSVATRGEREMPFGARFARVGSGEHHFQQGAALAVVRSCHLTIPAVRNSLLRREPASSLRRLASAGSLAAGHEALHARGGRHPGCRLGSGGRFGLLRRFAAVCR